MFASEPSSARRRGRVELFSGAQRNLAPGRYGNVIVHRGATLPRSRGDDPKDGEGGEVMVEESSKPEPEQNRHALLGVHCLLVEDDVHIAAVEKRILQRAGAIVDGVGTVAEAVSALELRAYDLL